MKQLLTIMAVFALISMKEVSAIRVGSDDNAHKSANQTAPAVSNHTKNESADAQTLAQKQLLDDFMKQSESIEQIQKQLSQPTIEQNSEEKSAKKDSLVQKILKEHQQNMTKNAPKSLKPIGPIALVTKPVVDGQSNQTDKEGNLEKMEDNINTLKQLFGDGVQEMAQEQKPVVDDSKAIIQRTIEMAKMEQQRKLHPLGGHLSDMFRGISDQLESPEQSSNFANSIEPASTQSTAQSFSTSSLDLIQNMTGFKDQKEIEPVSTEQSRAAIKKTLDLVKSQKTTVHKNVEQDQSNDKGYNSIAQTAGNLFKSLQSNFDDQEKNKEKMDEEKRARDLAAIIAQSSAQTEINDRDASIVDPDEYRLMHPFSGEKSTPKSLAIRLNSWEQNSEFVYKLESDKLKAVTDEAIKNETLIMKNASSTKTNGTVSNSSVRNDSALPQQQKNKTSAALPQQNATVLKNVTVLVVQNKTANTSVNTSLNATANISVNAKSNMTKNTSTNTTSNATSSQNITAAKNTTTTANKTTQNISKAVQLNSSANSTANITKNVSGNSSKNVSKALNVTLNLTKNETKNMTQNATKATQAKK